MSTMRKQTFLTRVQPNGDDASCTITTNAVDRDGDVIDPHGIDLTNYRRNPVVLFAHDYSDLPVGACTGLQVGPNSIRATWRWLKGDERAQRVKNAFDQGVLNACSIGFRVLEAEPRRGQNGLLGGQNFKKSEMLEFSIVPCPANAEAIRCLKANGLWTPAVEKAGRVLSQINEGHVRAALDHTQTGADHLVEVLRALDGDDGEVVLDVDDDTPASKRWPVIHPDDFAVDVEGDDHGDIDEADVKAALAEVLPDLMREARRQQIAASVVIELDQSAARHRMREGQLAAVRAVVPEMVARELRRARGRLD